MDIFSYIEILFGLVFMWMWGRVLIENDIFLQVHPSYSNQYDYDLEKIRTQIELLINNELGLVKINWGSVESLLKEQNGLATKVTVRK